MFGLPLETITLLISTGISFYMKFKAQQHADMMGLLKARIESNVSDSNLMDKAAARGTPWVRKFCAVLIISVAFAGLLVAPLLDIPVEYIREVPKNSFFFGLLKWGKTYEVISSDGFLIPPYVRHAVMAITGFFFGPGFAKVTL